MSKKKGEGLKSFNRGFNVPRTARQHGYVFQKHSAWRDRCDLHAVQQGKLHCQAEKSSLRAARSGSRKCRDPRLPVCEPGIQRIPRWKSHRFDHHRCHLLSCDEPDRHPVRTAGQRNHRCDEYHSVFRPVPRRRSVSSADPSDRPSAGTVFPDFRRSPAAV